MEQKIRTEIHQKMYFTREVEYGQWFKIDEDFIASFDISTESLLDKIKKTIRDGQMVVFKSCHFYCKNFITHNNHKTEQTRIETAVHPDTNEILWLCIHGKSENEDNRSFSESGYSKNSPTLDLSTFNICG